MGDGAIYTADATVRLIYSFDPLDITAYDGSYLHMWVYVTDHETIASGQIELTSSGTCDVAETAWNVTEHLTQNGWNEVWLPIDSAKGLADLAAVNYLRLFTIRSGNTATSAMYIDDVYFSMTK